MTSMYSSVSPSGTGGRGLALGLPGVVAGSEPADWGSEVRGQSTVEYSSCSVLSSVGDLKKAKSTVSVV